MRSKSSFKCGKIVERLNSWKYGNPKDRANRGQVWRGRVQLRKLRWHLFSGKSVTDGRFRFLFTALYLDD